MKVDALTKNPALESLFKEQNQVITLDANFFIPPFRSNLSSKSISFSRFQCNWLDPIFGIFPQLAIHEAVKDELVSMNIKTFIHEKEIAIPPQIIIHKDSELTSQEKILRDSVEDILYPFTYYNPQINNRKDRGEVKTLAYLAVKGLIYFASHDSSAIQLVEKAKELSTGLDTIQAIKMYEIIFFLWTGKFSDKKFLRMLYKYQYYMTKFEKSINPEWGDFIRAMESLYKTYL